MKIRCSGLGDTALRLIKEGRWKVGRGKISLDDLVVEGVFFSGVGFITELIPRGDNWEPSRVFCKRDYKKVEEVLEDLEVE